MGLFALLRFKRAYIRSAALVVLADVGAGVDKVGAVYQVEELHVGQAAVGFAGAG